MFTNIILLLVDDYRKLIKIESVDFLKFNRFKYVDHFENKSFIIACRNNSIAKGIKIAIESLLSNEIAKGNSTAVYNSDALNRVEELVDFYLKYLSTIERHDFQSIKIFEGKQSDFLYFSLNFHKVFSGLVEQLDDLINHGAKFEKVEKRGIKSIIYNRNLPALDELKFSWVYNEGQNIIIDYSGIVEWKSIGVFPTHRRLVELKYFK